MSTSAARNLLTMGTAETICALSRSQTSSIICEALGRS